MRKGFDPKDGNAIFFFFFKKIMTWIIFKVIFRPGRDNSDIVPSSLQLLSQFQHQMRGRSDLRRERIRDQ